MAETVVKEVKRKTPRRPSIGALMAASAEERTTMQEIMESFVTLPEPLQIIVASQIRKEIET